MREPRQCTSNARALPRDGATDSIALTFFFWEAVGFLLELGLLFLLDAATSQALGMKRQEKRSDDPVKRDILIMMDQKE